MLTRKQREVMLFIQKYHEREKIMPSYQEMANGLKLKSRGSVNALIVRLVERGFLKKPPVIRRGLEILKRVH